MEEVTFEGFNVVWTCPCSDWSSVDKYNLDLVASDGEIDYTHISRTDGKYFIMYLMKENHLYIRKKVEQGCFLNPHERITK